MKLWQKNSSSLHPFVEKFTVGDDIIFDSELLPYDIMGTSAHAKALHKIGILSKAELKKVITALKQLQKNHSAGKIKITVQDEDCHTVIENYLTQQLGNIGKKIHTGRSRNDQSLTALRLYTKEHLKIIKAQAIKLIHSLSTFAKKHQNVIFPGYSHTQQAMPTTLGHYILAFKESLTDDLNLLDFTVSHIDKNPLGTAAGFGTSLKLDRQLTAKELGFSQIQINSLYCQNSRGKFESAVIEALVQIMLTIGKLASDMLLFSSQEFDFFAVNQSLTTGSSIMPQKRNLDVLEIIRGYVTVITGNQHIIQNISQKILSGYNRDFQLIKKPLIESFKIVSDCLTAMDLFINGITPNISAILQKIKPEILAADIATQTAITQKIPFRTAYQNTLDQLKQTKTVDNSAFQKAFQKAIHNRLSLGGPGSLTT